jgi:branched-subunit amino acid transport protein
VGQLPAPVQRTLPHVGPAVLAAVVAAALVGGPEGAEPTFLAGAAVTAAVARRLNGIAPATACGLCAVVVLHLL